MAWIYDPLNNQIASDVDDVLVGAPHTVVKIEPIGSNRSIRSFDANSRRSLWIRNTSLTFDLTLEEAFVGAAVPNQILTGRGDVTLPPNGMATLLHWDAAEAWLLWSANCRALTNARPPDSATQSALASLQNAPPVHTHAAYESTLADHGATLTAQAATLAAKAALAGATFTGAFRYGGAALGSVTQLTNKSTGVTINTPSGTITTHNAALAGGAEVSFVVTNSSVTISDVPAVCLRSGGTVGSYAFAVSAVTNGSFTVTITNLSTTSRSEALVLNFKI
jgi:hypothetical protein